MTTRLTRGRLWLLDHLPAGILARPAEWFLALLCLVSGPSILLGLTTPRSVAALLPPAIVTAWGASLIVGSLGLVCGLTSYQRTPGGRWTIARVPCYRLGLRLLGLASILYVAALLWTGGWLAIPVSIFPVAFSLACGVRLLTLGSDR